jgi:histidinol-phosphate phosphatase family protein
MPLGTAGCLVAVEPGSEETLIVYGDMLFDIAVASLQKFHRRQDALLTIVAHPNDHPRTSDLIIEEDGLVKAILPHLRDDGLDHRNLVPAGLYLASPSFFGQLKSGTKMDMIHELLPTLVAAGARIAAYNTPEYLRDIGSSGRFEIAERDLAAGRIEAANSNHLRPAIFFDCDGVLNEEPGLQGALTPDDVKIIPGAGAALRRARSAGRLTVAITNRPQVAKGLITLEGLSRILGRLEADLAADGGVLDRIYFCPHHPEAGFAGEVPALKVRCECRKPGTLLLKLAVSELPIDRQRSAFIGDSLRDIGAARKFDIWAYGVRTGVGCRDRDRYSQENGTLPVPHLMFENVSEAVQFDLGYKDYAAPIIDSIRHLINGEGAPVVVGVCGRSRAGKTVTAHAIVRALYEKGIACLDVHLDDWIVPQATREASSSAESRNRVDAIPGVIRSLRAGLSVRAPGYDAATRGSGLSVTYNPTGFPVIIIEGSFAGHQNIRSMLNFTVFASTPEHLQRDRFTAFYRWKRLDAEAIEVLWRERAAQEWPAVDKQRCFADLVVTQEAGYS